MTFSSKSKRSLHFYKSKTRLRKPGSSSKGKGKQSTWEDVSDDESVEATSESPTSKQSDLQETLENWRSSRASLLGKGDAEATSMVERLISQSKASNVKQARAETNRGLKRTSGMQPGDVDLASQQSRSKGKGREEQETNAYRVERITLLTKGVLEVCRHHVYIHHFDADDKVPDSLKTHYYERLGLTISDSENGIWLRPDETYAQVDTRLRGYFPRIWDHFMDLENEQDGQDDDKLLESMWLVCMKRRQRLVVLPEADHPSGKDLARCAQKKQTSLQATRHPIPLALVKRWAKAAGRWQGPASTKTNDRAASPPSEPEASSSSAVKPLIAAQQLLKRKASCLTRGTPLPSSLECSCPNRLKREHGLMPERGLMPAQQNQYRRKDDSDFEMIEDPVLPQTPPHPQELLPEMGSFTIDDSIENPWGTALSLDF